MRRGARNLIAAAMIGTAAAMAVLAVATTHAQDVDLGALAVPDSVFHARSLPGPDYMSVFDRDNTRSNWVQTLTYARTTRRFAISTNGNITTQEDPQCKVFCHPHACTCEITKCETD